MRNTLRSFSLILLCGLAGLAQAAEGPKEIVTAYMAAWNAHDADKAATYLRRMPSITTSPSAPRRKAARPHATM